jgi:hypothetical protein
MPKLLLVIAACAFVILLGATVWLFWINRNEKLISRVSSILALGVAAVFVAVFAGMKDVNTERTFFVEWPYDSNLKSMPMIIPSSSRPFELMLSSASMRAASTVGSVNGNPPKRARPSNSDQVFTFYLELLQAQILHEIRDFQGTQKISSTESPSAFVPVKIPNNYRYSDDVLMPLMKTNPFLNEMDKFEWNHLGIQIPKGTEISFVSVPTSPSSGPEKRVVRLSKPNYFEIDIELVPRGMSPGVPEYLKGSQTLASQPGLQTHLERVGLMITERARFPRYTSQGSESAGYQQWVSDLFKAIQITFGE